MSALTSWAVVHSGGGEHKRNFTPKVMRQGVTGGLPHKRGPQLYGRLIRRRVPEESDMDMSDTLQAGTQRMATNKSHGGPLGGM